MVVGIVFPWDNAINRKNNQNAHMRSGASGTFQDENDELNFLNKSYLSEFVSMFGKEYKYIPLAEDEVEINHVIGEMRNKNYHRSIELNFYLVNKGEHNGVGDMFNNMWGISVKNEDKLFIDIETFKEFVGRAPLISDLIYSVNSGQLFKVTLPKDDSPYYSGGYLYAYMLIITEIALDNEETTLVTGDVTIDDFGELENLSTITDEQDNNSEPVEVIPEEDVEENPFW